MRKPISTRREIPFHYAKTEQEFTDDVYERYNELVTRQTALHLADELHGGYPFQDLLNYLLHWLPDGKGLTVADVGCSVGRLAGEVAGRHPDWSVHGIDLSYQMLRQANDYWVKGDRIPLNLTRYGFGLPTLSTIPLANLSFALARAEDLPFADASLDVLVNTFLIDRLLDPFAAFPEFHRVLRPGGRLITVTPLNFLTPDGWHAAHPPVKMFNHLRQSGWEILDWVDPLVLHEPMDKRGNAVTWACVAFVARK
ncbi:class I SAM-dependent methyltransferase [Neolewinella antarctica]|uniref:SAM-dependent methyltransferase n=1 Tax=Neolewinella antarctica TaxID=442734 RepID=A0ABX0XEZ4_9BACT|nr:class I SAM-dependent methyltransferase [Neolewinella antarctica]NJC27894.1 SAM-dependent methyltransferase [Neolewinella antarctica]